MTNSATLQAVRDHIARNWAATAFAFEGKDVRTPRPRAPYVVFDFDSRARRTERPASGGAREGAIVANVFVPFDQSAVAYDLADSVGGMLSLRTIGDARTRMPGFGKLLRCADDLDWMLVEVTVPFTIDPPSAPSSSSLRGM